MISQLSQLDGRNQTNNDEILKANSIEPNRIADKENEIRKRWTGRMKRADSLPITGQKRIALNFARNATGKKSSETKYQRHQLLSPDNCGVGLSSTRKVVGGGEAKEGGWPWMVQFSAQVGDHGPSGHLCGGALVSETHVLVAAHCFDSFG